MGHRKQWDRYAGLCVVRALLPFAISSSFSCLVLTRAKSPQHPPATGSRLPLGRGRAFLFQNPRLLSRLGRRLWWAVAEVYSANSGNQQGFGWGVTQANESFFSLWQFGDLELEWMAGKTVVYWLEKWKGARCKATLPASADALA